MACWYRLRAAPGEALALRLRLARYDSDQPPDLRAGFTVELPTDSRLYRPAWGRLPTSWSASHQTGWTGLVGNLIVKRRTRNPTPDRGQPPPIVATPSTARARNRAVRSRLS